MIKPVLYATGIKNKRVKHVQGLVYLIEDAQNPHDLSVCYNLRDVLIPIAETAKLNDAVKYAENFNEQDLLCQLEKQVDAQLSTMRENFRYPFGLHAICQFLNRETEYLEIKAIIDAHNAEIEVKRQAGIDAYKQAREQERLDYLKAACEKVKKGDTVTKDEFLQLIEHFNLKVSARTLGFIRYTLIEIGSKEASLSKRGKSQEIFKIYRALQEKV